MDLNELRQRIRGEMSVVDQYAYFDHAAVGPIPSRTKDSMLRYVREIAEHGDAIWPDWARQVQKTREYAAQLLRAKAEEIALIPNTSTGIGLVAEGFPWQPGDNVVVPENEFPSNLLPWRNLARRGVLVREVPVGDTGAISAEALETACDARTKLVALSWVGFSSGYRADLRPIVAAAHAKGALVMVDAIQGLGAMDLDLCEINVDFLCADGHKWMLGPEGAGVLFVREQHLDLLQPLGIGWNSLASGAFESTSTELKQTAARYEGGTYPMASMIGLGNSLDLWLECRKLGGDGAVQSLVLENHQELRSRLEQDDFQVAAPDEVEHRSGILGVTWDQPNGQPANLIAARNHLAKQHVITSVRGGCLRVSTHAYNNDEDFDRLLGALRQYRETH